MSKPDPESTTYPSVEESPVERAAALFFESTEAYFDAIRVGLAVSGDGQPRAVAEVGRQAELMSSSLQMAAGIIYDSEADDRNAQVAELLYVNEKMHGSFFGEHLVNYPGTTDDIEDITYYFETALEHSQDTAKLPERDLFLKAAGRACLANSQLWMKILNDWGRSL